MTNMQIAFYPPLLLVFQLVCMAGHKIIVLFYFQRYDDFVSAENDDYWEAEGNVDLCGFNTNLL